MTLSDCIRVLSTCGLLFFVLPYRVVSDPSAGRCHRIAAAFVRTCCVLELVLLALARISLGFGGLVAAVYLSWIVAWALWRTQGHWRGGAWRLLLLRILRAIEGGISWPHFRWRWRRPRISGLASLLLLLVAAAAIERSSYPLRNLRFWRAETYSRLLALESVARGGTAGALAGSITLLLPVVVFSGSEPAVVVRSSGPIFAVLLILAAGYCAWRISGDAAAAWFAMGLAAVVPLFTSSGPPGEISAAQLSAMFWLVSGAFFRTSPLDAICAAATAVLIRARVGIDLLTLGSCVVCALLVCRTGALRGGRRWPVLGTAAAAFTTILAMHTNRAPADTPVQYEAAARACSAIVRQFPRNTWMIVSPNQELALTYGRGWHMELIDLVSEFRPDDVARPEFRFPFPVRHVLIFVEKEPLSAMPAGSRAALARVGVTEEQDRSAAYREDLDRAAVEFQTADLLAAYARTHDDLQVFYEDAQLIVYQVPGRNPGEAAAVLHRNPRLEQL
jgi:hypothetical protein